MGSSLQSRLLSTDKELSAEGVAPAPFGNSPTTPSPTGSKKRSSLVIKNPHKKKVGQFSAPADGCENPQGMYFVCEHGHPIYRTVRCHARFVVDCSYCAKLWRKKVIKNFKKRVSKMKYPVFVTLTLKKPSIHSLPDLNALNHRCKKYLRRPKTRKKKKKKKKKRRKRRKKRKKRKKRRKGYEIRGSVSCLEPPNHIHGIWDCGYIPQKELSDTWRTITKDSCIVDIRKVEKPRYKKAVNELAKYLTKLSNYITKISQEGSCVDMHGVHVVNSWGDGGYYKKFRMVCRKCGAYFIPLWYTGQVDDYENDPVDFVEIDNDYG